MNDLRIALRRLRRAPAFAATAVLILAIGIGMATAMFTTYHAVVLRKLPLRDPDRIVVLWTFRDPTVELPVRVTEVDDLRRQSRTLSNIAGFVHWGALVSSRLLTGLLFQVSPTDPMTLAGVCVLLLGVGVGAAYLPARRAMLIDPAQALRAE